MTITVGTAANPPRAAVLGLPAAAVTLLGVGNGMIQLLV